MTSIAPEVFAAARRVMAGDRSNRAAAALEGALQSRHPFEEAFDPLLEALALYAPLQGEPYLGHEQVRDAIIASPMGPLIVNPRG